MHNSYRLIPYIYAFVHDIDIHKKDKNVKELLMIGVVFFFKSLCSVSY